jgi:hypothetical protein
VDVDAQTHPKGCLGATNVLLLLRTSGLLQGSASHSVASACTGPEDSFSEDQVLR